MEVNLRTDAEQDLSDAAIWYESQHDGLGRQFLTEVLRMFDLIGENPDMFPAVHSGVRRALLGRFPFGIYYKAEEDGVVVFAIMHGRRN